MRARRDLVKLGLCLHRIPIVLLVFACRLTDSRSLKQLRQLRRGVGAGAVCLSSPD